jgi:hypothetical protein
MTMALNLYWGDTHTNVHPRHVPQIDGVFDEAAGVLDFLAVAYYPFVHLPRNGLLIESWGQRDEFLPDWDGVCDAVRRHHRPREFVTFPGYEWHGNRTRWGDVNVFYNADEGPLLATADLSDLIEELRWLGGIAIPHHTAYRPADRGKDWSVHDEVVCPLVEIFSAHGSSEAIDAPLPMAANGDMGPRVSGGTVQAGLARGHRFGIIASNESHTGFAGRWGYGLMAAWADELTRDALWEAFLARRVYGVTGDRMQLDVRANGREMGEAFAQDGPVELAVDLTGCGSLDRVEILRNNRVVRTHNHRGTWHPPDSGRVHAKWRVLALGGPSRHTGFRDPEPFSMDLAVDVPGGRVVGVEPCFTAPGQRLEPPGRDVAAWHVSVPPRECNSTPNAQGVIVELEADTDAALGLSIDGQRRTVPVSDALRRTAVIPLMDESRERIRDTFDLSQSEVPNPDPYYHNAHKVLLSQADPETSYKTRVEWVDEHPEPGTNTYYVRVSQDNGQMAWSSPIWVERSGTPAG